MWIAVIILLLSPHVGASMNPNNANTSWSALLCCCTSIRNSFMPTWLMLPTQQLSGVQLCSLIHNKLWCTVYSDAFSSESWTFYAIWAPVTQLMDWTTWLSLGRPWPCHWLAAAPFLTTLKDTDNCRPGTPQTSCSLGNALTQSSSHHSFALFKLHFSCF